MKKFNTLQRITPDEYPNGLPGKRQAEHIKLGYLMSMTKSGIVYDHTEPHDKLTLVMVDDAFFAKSFYGENNEHHAYTTRIVIDGKSYSYCLGSNSWKKTRLKDIFI